MPNSSWLNQLPQRPIAWATSSARRQRVDHRRDPDPLAPGADHRADRAEGDRAPDAEAAVPDVEDLPRVAVGAEVELVVGGDVVEPAADQAERHRPDREVLDLAGAAAAGRPAPLADPDRGDDAEDDRERVAADRERAEVPDAVGRARDGQGGDQAVTALPGGCGCRAANCAEDVVWPQ